VSIETTIVMKCNFVTETDILKKIGFCSNESSYKIKLSAIILTQFLYEVDVVRMIYYGS